MATSSETTSSSTSSSAKTTISIDTARKLARAAVVYDNAVMRLLTSLRHKQCQFEVLENERPISLPLAMREASSAENISVRKLTYVEDVPMAITSPYRLAIDLHDSWNEDDRLKNLIKYVLYRIGICSLRRNHLQRYSIIVGDDRCILGHLDDEIVGTNLQKISGDPIYIFTTRNVEISPEILDSIFVNSKAAFGPSSTDIILIREAMERFHSTTYLMMGIIAKDTDNQIEIEERKKLAESTNKLIELLSNMHRGLVPPITSQQEDDQLLNYIKLATDRLISKRSRETILASINDTVTTSNAASTSDEPPAKRRDLGKE